MLFVRHGWDIHAVSAEPGGRAESGVRPCLLDSGEDAMHPLQLAPERVNLHGRNPPHPSACEASWP